MSVRRQLLIIVAALCVATASFGGAPAARGRTKGLSTFVRAAKPARGRQHYLAGHRVPGMLSRLVGRRGVKRSVVQVSNTTLDSYVKATSKGYLEVVIPANTGHVWFRHGDKLFDFGPEGFRVGPVRQIKSERYGVLVPLTAKQEQKLAHYLGRLQKTNGAELGLYDFHGDKGFHCVTWVLRQSFGKGESNLVQALGGTEKDGDSMPNFARFMVKRAHPVDAVVLYSNDTLSSKQLDKKKFDIMSIRQLRRANRAMED